MKLKISTISGQYLITNGKTLLIIPLEYFGKKVTFRDSLNLLTILENANKN